MSSAIYISHTPEDHGLASKLQAHLRDHVFERDPSSPTIKTVFFILNYKYLYDPTAETNTLAFLNRPGVWCIPLFYHLWPHELLNMCRTPQAKPFWQAMKDLKGEVFDRGDENQFVQQVVGHLRNGPRGSSTSYDVFLSHAGEVKPFCEKLNTKLHQQGIKTFLDKFDITGGPNSLSFSEEILGAIERSKVVVAVLSHHFPSKKWPVLEITEVCRKSEGAKVVLPVYYQISRVQCMEIVNYAREPQGREALAWLFAQPGIEHFGKHAGEQEREDELLQTIVRAVSSLLQRR